MGQLFKNVASQKLRVFAFADAGHATLDAGEPVTGDAANISARTAVDNAALGPSNDAAPTEVDATNAPGYYEFDPTQGETNGDVIEWYPKSSTAGVQVVTVGGNVQTTQPQYLPNLNIASDGDFAGNVDGSVGSLATQAKADVNAEADTAISDAALATAADLATVDGIVDSILAIVGTTGVVVAAASKTGYALSAAGIQAVWDAATSALTTAGSIGKALVDWMAAYTTTRAGYLDNLNTGGLVASAADVAGITQAQRVRVIVPSPIERPDAGSTTYRVWIYAYNEQHQAEDLDSNPTVTAENNAGTDRSVNLGTVTKPTGTGIYYVDYTLDSGDAIEGLVFRVTATEGAVATEYAAATLVVDTTAVDFTAADRAKLATLHDTRIPGVIQPQTGDAFARLGAPSGASVSADIAAVKGDTASTLTAVTAIKAVTDLLPNAGALSDLASILATVDSVTHGNAALKALIDTLDGVADAIKAKTDNLPASPAAVGSAMTLTSGERDSIAAAILDLADSIETSLTVRLALRYIAAACAGVTENDGKTFKGAGVATTRITATVSGKNRTAVVLG